MTEQPEGVALTEDEHQRANRIALWKQTIRDAWSDEFTNADAVIDSLIGDVLAAQAERVKETVEKVLGEAGFKPIIATALAEQVAAELQAGI